MKATWCGHILLFILQLDKVASNFESRHHAGTLNTAITAINRQLNLFVNEGAGSPQQVFMLSASC
nr:hypothetical protein [Polynucleobacter paneuropaeus]